MITMLDVAKRAGVSKATVSRVLNGQNIVSTEVKALVIKAIEETGYRPNILARQLAKQESNFIGFILTNTMYNGPYFSSLIYNVASLSEQKHHQLIFADSKHSAKDERNAVQYLLDMKCAGIIVYPKYLDSDELDTLIEQTDTPIVVINKQLKRNPLRSVYIDHYKSAEYLMNHLLQCGHRDIAFISGLSDSLSGQSRLQAYHNALHAADIAVDPKRIIAGDWSPESGYLAIKTLLRRKVPFTCVLAANDDMAIGAIKALTEAGIRIPEQISIAGFDNSVLSRYLSPALTTVHIPIDAMIQTAIEKIINPELNERVSLIDGQLIIRQSVKKWG